MSARIDEVILCSASDPMTIATVPTVFPRALRAGDRVVVVAPAGPVDRSLFFRGLLRLRAQYDVRVAPNALLRTGYFAGDDDARAGPLSAAMQDPEVRAILAARGGYGCLRIVDRLPWAQWREHPSWIVGFSDITTLHLEAQRRGVGSLHGPNVTGLGTARPKDIAALLSVLEGTSQARSFEVDEVLVPGSASGPIVGGNLTLVVAAAALGRLPSLDGAILFLEDVGERPYRIDRMLQTLLLSGVLRRVAAVVWGAFTDCAPGPDGTTVETVLRQATATVGCPAVRVTAFGHGMANAPVVLGGRAIVDVHRFSLHP